MAPYIGQTISSCASEGPQQSLQMINLILSLVAGLVVFLIFQGFFSWYAALLPGILALLATYIVLAQRTMKVVAALSDRAQKEMQAQKFDRAADTFRSGLALSKRQFLVGPLMHANLGMLLYVQKEFEKARPHLEKGYPRNYVSRAMLACYHFKKQAWEPMKKEFETAVKYGKKDGLIWSLYAYALVQSGDKDGGLQVLGRAVQRNPTDERLKANLLAVQNNKRMKMRAYGPQFYQFHLEPPPPDLGGRRVVWQRR